MKRVSLANSVAKSTGIYIALAAALVAALATMLVFSAKEAEAVAPTLKVDPINVDLDKVATGSVETTTITLTNEGDEVVEIGAIDLSALDGTLGDVEDLTLQILDVDGNELLDLESLLGILGILDLDDLLGDTLELTDTLELQPGETIELVVGIVPQTVGALDLGIDLLNDNNISVLPAPINIIGNPQQCTDLGQTEGNDTIVDTGANEIVCGLGGNDIINATAGGDDVILGGGGNDVIRFKDGVKKEFANGNSGLDLCKKKAKDKKDNTKSCGKKNNKRK